MSTAITTDMIHTKTRHIIQLMNEVRDAKAAHPELKCSFYAKSPGSILNAYREGDLSFDDAVRAIEDLVKAKYESGPKAELARLADTLATECRKHADTIDYAKRVGRELDQARHDLQVKFQTERGEVWFWQGDGQDFPESLTCPVVMSAETLRELLKVKGASP